MPRTEVTGSQIKDSTVNLTADVAGILPVSKGGSGADSIALNNVVLGNGTGAVQTVAPGNSGNVLTSNGSTWVSSEMPLNQLAELDGGGPSDTDTIFVDGGTL